MCAVEVDHPKSFWFWFFSFCNLASCGVQREASNGLKMLNIWRLIIRSSVNPFLHPFSCWDWRKPDNGRYVAEQCKPCNSLIACSENKSPTFFYQMDALVRSSPRNLFGGSNLDPSAFMEHWWPLLANTLIQPQKPNKDWARLEELLTTWHFLAKRSSLLHPHLPILIKRQGKLSTGEVRIITTFYICPPLKTQFGECQFPKFLWSSCKKAFLNTGIVPYKASSLAGH